MRKGLKDFDIDILSLSNKKHSYQFEIDSSFFEGFEGSYINKGRLSVSVVLDKSDTMLQAQFAIKGSVELVCDRSAELFDFEINAEPKLIFKFGEDYKELDEEIVIIPRTSQKINIAQYLYEFILLEVPIKKIHPKLLAEDENVDGDGFVVYSTQVMENEENTEQSTNTIWDKLKKISKEK